MGINVRFESRFQSKCTLTNTVRKNFPSNIEGELGHKKNPRSSKGKTGITVPIKKTSILTQI